MPLIFLIGTIPITPGGLGTTSAATVELLSPHLTGSILSKVGAKQILFAASLMWVFVNYVLKAILGAVLLKIESRDMFKEVEIPEEKLEKEASHFRVPE